MTRGTWLVLLALGVAAWGATTAVAEQTVRTECVADTAIFHYKSLNRAAIFDVNFGAAEVVPFHGIHYLKEAHDSFYAYLADFDVSGARKLKVQGAALHLRLEPAPDADKLRLVTVSTVAAPWNEGKGTGKDPETKGGGATSNWAVFGQRRWADPQSELIDVIIGQGFSLYRTVPVRHEKDGWVTIDVPAEVAQALVSGGSSGLALFEEKGQTNIVYRIRTRESADKPYLVIQGTELPAGPPAAVRDLKVEPAGQAATLKRGAVQLTMTVAEGTNRLAVAWRIGDGLARPLEHWRTPWPAVGAMSMVIDDLPAGEPIEVIVQAIGPGGGESQVSRAKGTVSTAKPLPTALVPDRKPNPTGEPKVYGGRMRIWAYGDCEAAHPVSGNLLEEVGFDRYAGEPAGEYRRGNAAWNGPEGIVTLAGGRNEVVAFNLAIEAVALADTEKGSNGDNHGPATAQDHATQGVALGPVSVTLAELRGPDGFIIPAKNVQAYRLWYLQDKEWKGELCVPLPADKGFVIPDPDNKVPGQRNQSVLVDVWIPKGAPAGAYRGTLTVTAAGLPPVDLPVQLEVWPIELPDTLSFNCELNAYSSAALSKDYAHYRLAHAHRTTLNVLPYSQNGSLKAQFELPLEGKGEALHVADWSKYDDYYAPLLDGTAFKDMPGAGVPLASQYLPFSEAWPLNFRDYYAFKPADLHEHALTAGPIESMIDKAYEQGVQAVYRDWAEHFRRKGWTRTQMQFFLNNKQMYTKGKLGFWALDEPQHRDDFLALRYWGQLFKTAVAGQQDTRFIFRGDISRPHMQRDWFDGLMDTEVVGSSEFFAKSRIREDLLRRGFHFYPYGSLNPIRDSNLNAEAWPVAVYLLGGEGLVPWDTIGTAAHQRKAEPTAVLVPAPPGSPAGTTLVASARLKALRRGQQDVEYLALLSRQKGYDREQVAGLVASLLNLQGTTSERFVDEAGETIFADLTTEQFAKVRAAIAAQLARKQPAPETTSGR